MTTSGETPPMPPTRLDPRPGRSRTRSVKEGADLGRPFLKWAGGKRQLVAELLRHTPPRFSSYFEPFVGGGALFFALRPGTALLADRNERLIQTYRGVQGDVERVITLLKTYPHDPNFYYRFREIDVDRLDDAEVAAWFIYLNKTGYNGLYRVNRDDRFNVPFGRYARPAICDESTLRACSAALAHVSLLVADFEDALRSARRGDFVYFDPPYTPISVTSSFTSYTARGFGPAEQARLRNLARALKDRGVHVLLSNSAAPSVRELYRDGFELLEVSATRAINSKATGRRAIGELLIK